MLGGVWFGERQLNNDCGLSPLKTNSTRFGSFAANVATPPASANAGACPDAASQWSVGEYPAVVDGTPSHCSMNTGRPGVNPLAVTVNSCGFPAPSPGTTNGFVVGVVICVTA